MIAREQELSGYREKYPVNSVRNSCFMFHLIFGRRHCHSLFLAAVLHSSRPLILSSRSYRVADGEIFGAAKRGGGLKMKSGMD